MQPGLYRLDIAIKDVNNPDHIGIYGRALNVPFYEDEKLGASSLILADEMNTVPPGRSEAAISSSATRSFGRA